MLVLRLCYAHAGLDLPEQAGGSPLWKPADRLGDTALHRVAVLIAANFNLRRLAHCFIAFRLVRPVINSRNNPTGLIALDRNLRRRRNAVLLAVER
jgi:hypothetical protein